MASREEKAARIAALTRAGRNCCGNNGRCFAEAKQVLMILPLRDGIVSGEPQIRKVCGYGPHIWPYTNSSNWRVVSINDLGESAYSRKKKAEREAQRESAKQMLFLPPTTGDAA